MMGGHEVHVPLRREPSEAERDALAIKTEMNALTAIVEGFEAMPDEARSRTLRYLSDRYGQRPTRDAFRPPVAERPSERVERHP